MPNPLPPDSERTSIRRILPASSGSSVRTERKDSDPSPIQAIEQALDAVSEDNSPTVISTNRQRQPPDKMADQLMGRQLGHFELLESVGVGGMAAVIKARDLDLSRIVALKILPPDMATDPENIIRFKQEARAAAKLDHDNVARVYFCGEDQGLHFIAFEFVEGENLRTKMEHRGGLLPVQESIHYMIQVAAGLSHAASRGVVHRDIKPSNILITPEGKAKIVDMGLARNLDPHSINGGVTQSGVTLGTFDYISPEQAIEPRCADCRSDIYSLGCTFYHVLTGSVPVPDGTAAKKLHAHQHVAPLDPRILNPDIPDELAAILGRMMAKDPAHRYQHPDHLVRHLIQLAEQLHLPVQNVLLDPSTPNPYVDQALPPPPKLSAMWIGFASLILILIAVVISGGFGGKQLDPLDTQPLYPIHDKKTQAQVPVDNNPPEKKDPPTVVPVRGARIAKDTTELVALLQEARVTTIKLKPGTVYDLTQPLAIGDDPPEALFLGKELTLEGDANNPPKLRFHFAPEDDGKTPRPGSITFRVPAESTGRSTITLKDLHLEPEMPSDTEGDVNWVGLSLMGWDRVDLQRCLIAPTRLVNPSADGPASMAIQGRSASKSGQLLLRNCAFGIGNVAVQVMGRLQIEAEETSFAPQWGTVFECESANSNLALADRPTVTIRMKHCSALLRKGSLIDLADQIPCQISVGHCLFSAPEEESVLIRQFGMTAPATRLDGIRFPTAMPNGYHNLKAIFQQGQTQVSVEDLKAGRGSFIDNEARVLTNPWQNKVPLPMFEKTDRLHELFKPQTEAQSLRIKGNDQELLGATAYLGKRLYDFLPPVEEKGTLADNQKVVDPNLPAPLPGHYKKLAEAIANARPKDEILIRENGPMKIAPATFANNDTDITIKPFEGFKPILIADQSAVSMLFDLKSGRLVLEGLHLVLDPTTGRSLVDMPRGGECLFRRCLITLKESDVASLAVVTLSDNPNEMMMGVALTKGPPPKIQFENCFIRGRGRLVNIPRSRPFDLEVKNSLLVLDHAVVAIEAATKEIPTITTSTWKLHQSTIYASGGLLHLSGSVGMDGNRNHIVPMQIQPTNCVFMPASASTVLIQADRFDSEDLVKNLLAWDAPRHNLYGFADKQEILRIVPDNPEVLLLKRFEKDEWLSFTRESSKSFRIPLQFKYQPPEPGRLFSAILKSGFSLRSPEKLPKLEDGSNHGVDLDTIPDGD